MGKIAAVAAAFAIFGFLAGRWSQSADETTERAATGDSVAPAANDSCEKFQTMYDRLRADYIKLQDESREESATAGVCSPGHATDGAPAPQEMPQGETKVAQEEPQPALTEPETDDPAPTPGENPAVTPAVSELDLITSGAPATEAELKKADRPSKKRKFLDRIKLANAMQTIDAMSPVTTKDKYYNDLHGHFRGTIRFQSKGRKNGKVSMLVRKPDDVDPPNPKAWLIRIDVDNGMGKVTRQNGGFDMLRTTGNQSSAFSIRSSETSYLQMFYQESTDEFIGNYYEKNNKGEYPRRGSFTLKRQPG